MRGERLREQSLAGRPRRWQGRDRNAGRPRARRRPSPHKADAAPGSKRHCHGTGHAPRPQRDGDAVRDVPDSDPLFNGNDLMAAVRAMRDVRLAFVLDVVAGTRQATAREKALCQSALDAAEADIPGVGCVIRLALLLTGLRLQPTDENE